MKSPRILAATIVFAALALFIGSTVNVFSIDALAQSKEICDNGKDDDGDGLIDGNDPDCKKTGEGCSPGFYKNHTEIWDGICCDGEGEPACADLLEDLTCKGSDAECGRSASAAFLDACTGCTE